MTGSWNWWNYQAIRCGANVDANICMEGGFVESPVDGQQDLMYTCKSYSEEPNEGIYVGAN